MKIVFYSKSGTPVDLTQAEDVCVKLPYHGEKFLEKTMLLNGIKIIDAKNGEAEVKITSFEKNGMELCEGKTFSGCVFYKHKKSVFSFKNCFSVAIIENEKQIMGAI